MKKTLFICLLLVGASELCANPVAPKSTFGFNAGWTTIAGLMIEFGIAFSLLRKHLSNRKEFIFRFLGVHIATLPICFFASSLDAFPPWILAQSVVIFSEAWFYTKAPGNPKWRIAGIASFIANSTSALFAIATHKL